MDELLYPEVKRSKPHPGFDLDTLILTVVWTAESRHFAGGTVEFQRNIIGGKNPVRDILMALIVLAQVPAYT